MSADFLGHGLQVLDEGDVVQVALDELTHEDLRSDRMFLIFLIQCGNVINKIQAKIALCSAKEATS